MFSLLCKKKRLSGQRAKKRRRDNNGCQLTKQLENIYKNSLIKPWMKLFYLINSLKASGSRFLVGRLQVRIASNDLLYVAIKSIRPFDYLQM